VTRYPLAPGWLSLGLVCAATGGLALLWWAGVAGMVLAADWTGICAVIMLLWLATSVWGATRVPVQTSHWLMVSHIPEFYAFDRPRTYPGAWFIAQVMVGLGLLGTVIGFAAMLSWLPMIDPDNAQATRRAIAGMGSGMATALYTTGTGLLFSLLTQAQYHLLEMGWRWIDAAHGQEAADRAIERTEVEQMVGMQH
jgi:hypothetical protein